MENSVTMNQANMTVSAASAFDTARCLLELNAVKQSDLQHNLPIISRLLESGWDATLVESRCPEQELIFLWQMAQSSSQFDIGAQVALTQNTSHYGLLAKWAAQCVTLKEAVQLFINNIGLLNPSEQWEMIDNGHECEFLFNFKYQNTYPNIAAHRSLLSLILWGHELSGKPLKVAEIYLPQATDDLLTLFSRYADKCLTSSGGFKLIISQAMLEHPILYADAYLKKILKDQASKVLKNASGQLKDKVMTHFHQDIHAFKRADSMSKALNLSTSSMYRRLKQEGVGFSELLEQFRQIRFQSLEEHKLSSAALADTLGFTDVSSFLKAKKRWSIQKIERCYYISNKTKRPKEARCEVGLNRLG